MIRRLRLDRELCFPNELIVNADGFTVVNTNLHKLQRFRWSEDGRSLSSAGEWLTVRQGRERVNCPDPNEAFFVRFFHRERGSGSPARAFNIATPGRVWPMRAVQMKDGSMWVLNARNGMAMADVVRFAPGMTRPSLVLSGVNHDPIALLARADDVLVSDLEGPAILRFSHSGEPKGMFGGPAFVEQMQMIHRAGERRRDLHRVGLVGLVVVLLLAVSFQIWQLRRRVRWVIAQEPTF